MIRLAIQQLINFLMLIPFVVCTGSVALGQNEVDSEKLFELPLEKLMEIEVTTSSKRPETISEAPDIISTMTSEEIQMFGANNLLELFERFTSILPVFGVFSGTNTIIMRGDKPNVNQGHILILLNGNPIGRESYLNLWNQAFYSSFPISIIERIEVIHGPGSVLYGTNAFIGIINVITKGGGKQKKSEYKKENQFSNELFASSKVGSFKSGGGEAYYSYQYDSGLKVSSALKYFDTDGWPFSANRASGEGVSGYVFQHNNLGLMTQVDYKNFEANIFFGYTHQFDWRESRSTPTSFINRVFFPDLSYRFKLFNDWTLNSHLSFRLGSTDLFIEPEAPPPLGGDGFIINYLTNDQRLENTISGKLIDKVNILAGVVINHVDGSLEPNPPGMRDVADLPLSYSWNQYWLSAYFQADYSPWSSVKFVAGSQYNKISDVPGSFVPRLGGLFYLTPHLGIKLLYGEAFRAPTPGEVYFPFTTGSLQSETVNTTEFQLFWQNKFLQSNLTLYQNNESHLITREGGIATYPRSASYINFGDIAIHGIELESKYFPQKNFYLFGSYSFQENQDSSGNSDVTMAPHQMLKLGLGYSSPNWKGGVFNSLISSFQGNTGVNPHPAVVNPSSQSYDLLSLNATTHLKSLLKMDPRCPEIDLSLYITNLLDVTYEVPDFSAGYVNTIRGGAGRGFYVDLAFKAPL